MDTSVISNFGLSKTMVSLHEPIPLEEFPETPFLKNHLNLRLKRCLPRALRLGDISLMGEVNIEGSIKKVYLSGRLSRSKLIFAHIEAEKLNVRKCLKGKERGTGYWPSGKFNSEKQAVLDMFTPKRISRILKEACRIMENIRIASDYAAKDIRTAWWSDGFGAILASVICKILKEECGITAVSGGKCDANADLIFPDYGLNVEIKVMTGEEVWQGGEYTNLSRLQSPTLLISRNHAFSEFWVGLVPAIVWESSMKKKQKRYATTVQWSWVRDNPHLKTMIGEQLDGKMIKHIINDNSHDS